MTDQPPNCELLRRVNGCAVDQLSGPSGADPRREALRTTGEGEGTDHGLDLSDYRAGGRPDQIAGECDLERAGEATTVDERQRWDGNLLDRGDQRQRGAHQRLGLGLIKACEDRDVSAG